MSGRFLRRLSARRYFETVKLSPLARFSPLPRSRAAAPSSPAGISSSSDRVELGTSRVEAAPRSGRARLLAASALGFGVLSALTAVAGPAQVMLRTVVAEHHPVSIVGTSQLEVEGYAGEAATDRAGVARSLEAGFSSLDRNGDGKVNLSEVQRTAADPAAVPDLQASSQALLADPALAASLDVASQTRVDDSWTRADLSQFLRNEGGGDFGSYRLVEDHLSGPVFAELSGGSDQLRWDQLQDAAASPATPAPARAVARQLLDNPNYFNAFDVSRAHQWPQSLNARRDGVVSAADLDQIAMMPLPEGGRQFSAAQAAGLDRVLSGGQISSDLYGGFRQTDRGNCASTATIKAAMRTFGSDIFARVDKQADGRYHVTMRDGFQLTVSPSELEAAATAAHYQGDDAGTQGLATLSYASMAKRALWTGHEGARTYGQALLSLNNGEITENVPSYLGLEHHVHHIPVSQVPGQAGAVESGNGHAYYVDTVDGQTLGDKWGDATLYKGLTFVDQGAPQDHAFILTR